MVISIQILMKGQEKRMSWIIKLFCFLGVHKSLYVVRKLKYTSRLIGCRECKRYFGMNDEVQAVLPFDEEMYDLYAKQFKLKGLKKYITKKTFMGFL